MDSNPYEVLQVEATATPLEIKKAYKKLCLQYHPDKIQQQNTEIDKHYFPKVQFAYSILSDPLKRSRYDSTGSVSEGMDGFDWKEYFQNVQEKITIDMIEEDRAKYQGSLEEKADILHNFVYYDGDFLKLFEVIPHLEFDEAQESRVFDIVEQDAASADMGKSWEKYKKSRKTKVKQMLKKLAKEAKQAEALAKKIKKPIKTESDLKAMIQKKNAGRLDDLISSLESKYGKKGRGEDIDDAEFERIQKKMRR